MVFSTSFLTFLSNVKTLKIIDFGANYYAFLSPEFLISVVFRFYKNEDNSDKWDPCVKSIGYGNLLITKKFINSVYVH